MASEMLSYREMFREHGLQVREQARQEREEQIEQARRAFLMSQMEPRITVGGVKLSDRPLLLLIDEES